jgi:2-polyprenyl-3-methyl-5-hydroxy-6-metoxy-1,4-benzoquinol methylase
LSIFTAIAKKIKFRIYLAKWARAASLVKPMEKEYLNDAAEFLFSKGYIKEGEDLNRLAKKWQHYINLTFDPKDPDKFYSKWVGEQGASNIAANIKDQFAKEHIAYAFWKYIGTNNFFRGTMLDFGCGTAAMSFSWRKNFAGEARLILADVDNLAKEFTGYAATKYAHHKTRLCSVDIRDVPDGTVDLVICAHVLEHLKNPSEVFKKVSGKVKKGGILILEAPWGGQPEHLPEAPVDWENNGGRKILENEYVLLEKLYPYDPASGQLSGVYQKIVL